MIKIFIRALSVIVIPIIFGLIIGFAIPLLMLSQSADSYSFFKPQVFITYGIVLSLYFSCVFFALVLPFYYLGGVFWAHRIMGFMFGWVVISGFISPLVISNGMSTLSEKSLNFEAFIGVFLGSILVGWIASSKLRFAAIVFLLIVIIGSVSTVVPSVAHVWPSFPMYPKETSFSDIYHVSSESNIFVISFDGVPENIIADLFKKNPELALPFKDFIFYANAVSLAPDTVLSITSSLYGNLNYHDLASTQEVLIKSLDKKILPQNLILNSFSYGPYQTFSDYQPLIPTGGLYQDAKAMRHTLLEHKRWFSLSLTRAFFKVFNDQNTGVPKLLEKVAVYFGGQFQGEETVGYEKGYQGPEWKLPFLPSYDDYTAFVGRLDANKKGLSIRQLHFTFSHYPIDFDSKCHFRGKDKVWFEKSQNYQGLLEEGLCEISLFTSFIEKLKSLNIYDKSLIILKSDHGEPVSYYDTFPNNLKINGNALWGFNRYRPLLMIKNKNVSQAQISYSRDLVTLGDLAPTVCIASGFSIEYCKMFPGLNLLDKYNISDSPFFYVNYTPNPQASFMFDTHKTVKLRRDGLIPLQIFTSTPELNVSE